MLEGSETALAGEEKQVKFKPNMIFYWTGAALSFFLLVGAIGSVSYTHLTLPTKA